jgi:DNA-binding beta-propeller fold protein YncE
MRGRLLGSMIAASIAVAAVTVFISAFITQAAAQPAGEVPQFKYDASWPKPLPEGWVLGSVGSVCVDANDHVFVLTRGATAPKERNLATAAPPVLEFDDNGNLVNSWGNRATMAKTQHGCFIDKEGNFWTAGNNDGMVQKYTHDGSKLLLQIGTKGVMDSADGTETGKALNASRTSLYKPAQIAVDPANGEIYVSDGYGNKRVVVFDRDGHYLRQWGRQATQAETDAGVGGVFLGPVHCVTIANDNLVYVCDRLGDRIEVFDKMGNFKRNIVVHTPTAHRTNSENAVGTAGAIGFSTDQAQTFMYVANGADNVIHILNRATGEVLAKFGRPGNQPGDLTDPHSMAVNSKGDIIIGEVPYGGKLQIWRLVKK